MEPWIAITVGAAFLQNVRSTLQKHLKGTMSTTSATFVRFGFGVPVAIGAVAGLHYGAGQPLPHPGLPFWLWAALGGVAQILANFLLIHLFSYRNFVVGTAYSRTEPAQAAVFGYLFLDDIASAGALLAIGVTVAGVMLISVARTAGGAAALAASVFSRTAGIGVASGTLFGLAAVAYRGASLSLGGPSFLMQAACTLAYAIVLQSVLMLLWLALREPAELARIGRAWQPALATGLVGATASLGWFAAMTLQQAAVVKALAQIEFVFTIASSVLFFREHINRREILGTALIVAGIVLLVLL